MCHHRRQAPSLDVRALASDEFELAPEWRGGEPAKGFVEVDHARSNAIARAGIRYAEGLTTRAVPPPQHRSTSASIFPAIIRKSMR